MKTLKLIATGALLALVSTAALAFQEQQGGSATPTAPAAAAAEGKTLDMAPGSIAPSTGASGTEVRIPGLGKLGVLPKMDFGLELLYGAAERKPAAEAPRDPSEDLTIRGSVKHRF